MTNGPFDDIPEIQESIKKFFNEAPLKEILNFIAAFEHLGAGEIVRKLLIAWIDLARK